MSNYIINQKTRMYKALMEKYEYVGGVAHAGLATLELLNALAGEEVLIIAPKATHEIFEGRNQLTTPQKYVKQPTYPKFILWIYASSVQGRSISMLLRLREETK